MLVHLCFLASLPCLWHGPGPLFPTKLNTVRQPDTHSALGDVFVQSPCLFLQILSRHYFGYFGQNCKVYQNSQRLALQHRNILKGLKGPSECSLAQKFLHQG